MNERGLLTFRLDPAILPNPVQLRFVSPEGTHAHGRPFDAMALRDALEIQDVEHGANMFGGASGAAGAGPGGGLAPDEAILEVRYENGHHRLIKTMSVELLKTFKPEVKIPQASRHVDPITRETVIRFKLRESEVLQLVALKIRIPSPQGPTKPPILDIFQTFDVVRSGKTPSLVPTEPLAQGNKGLHRRFTSFSDVKQVGTVATLKLDVRFLDVTAHVCRVNTEANEMYARPLKCRVSILEYTGGDKPQPWIVAIPPAVDPSKAKLNALLFFRHEYMKPFTSADDIDYREQVAFYLLRPANVGTYWTGIGSTFVDYPNLGWDRQLATAGKPVALVMPIPDITNFGDMHTPAKARAKGVMDGFLTCYWADLAGPNTKARPSLGRIAAGGWSSGVETVVDWCTADTSIFEEVYAFDGAEKSKNKLNLLAAWFKPHRKLRLIGTANTEIVSITLGRLLRSQPGVPPANVTTLPGETAYWYTNVDYKRAHANSQLKKNGPLATPPVDASDVSHVFLEKEVPLQSGDLKPEHASVTLRWTSPSGVKVTGEVPFLSATEAASLVRDKIANTFKGAPISSEGDFKELIRMLKDSDVKQEPVTVWRLRHPWSAFGGIWDYKGRGSNTFTGYFQICLEDSDFS
jgi:hypothetical protein